MNQLSKSRGLRPTNFFEFFGHFWLANEKYIKENTSNCRRSAPASAVQQFVRDGPGRRGVFADPSRRGVRIKFPKLLCNIVRQPLVCVQAAYFGSARIGLDCVVSDAYLNSMLAVRAAGLNVDLET